MNNLAILIDRPGHSQKFLSLASALNQLPSNINAVVFYCEPGPVPFKIHFPMMDMMYAYNFEGIIISTDIYTTLVMNNLLCPIDKYYYVWDLEYIYEPHTIPTLKSVFSNKLIARNKVRNRILTSTWHKPVKIIEDFNENDLRNLFS